MKLLRTVFFYFMLVTTFFIGTTATILFSVFDTEDARAKRFQRSAKTWARLLAFISGIPVRVEGIENVPKNEAVILASNHQGAADILILLACLPTTFVFIIKKELFKVPIFGWYLKQAGYVPVDRGTRRGAVEMFIDAEKKLKSGNSILIFPEGTRSPDGNLQEFKRGSLLLAFRAKARVLPIAISGSFNIMPKKSFVINKIPVKLNIGKPISLGQYGDDYNNANDDLYKIIKGML